MTAWWATHKIWMDLIGRYGYTDCGKQRQYFAAFKVEASCRMTTKGEFSLGQKDWIQMDFNDYQAFHIKQEVEDLKHQHHVADYRHFNDWHNYARERQAVFGWGGVCKLTDAFVNNLYIRASHPERLWINWRTVRVKTKPDAFSSPEYAWTC